MDRNVERRKKRKTLEVGSQTKLSITTPIDHLTGAGDEGLEFLDLDWLARLQVISAQ